MIYRVSHLTEYSYAEPVTSSHHQLHLSPRPLAHQESLWEELSVDPEPTRRTDRNDYFGNRATHLEIREPHTRLAVLARAEIDVHPAQATLPRLTPPWETVRDDLRRARGPASLDAYEMTFASTYVPLSARARDYATPSFTPERPMVDAAVDLMHRIHRDFTYDPQATTVSTPVDEVFARQRGVCQDFAHITLACLRAIGLPGRYVSGYLVTSTSAPVSAPRVNAGLPPAATRETTADDAAPAPATATPPPLVGADASHAWLQIYCPGVGWIDLDPTNDIIPGDRHITVAYGRDFGDVTPLRGVILGGGNHSLRVAVEVLPLPTISDRT